MLLLAALVSAVAEAACAVQQEPIRAGVRFQIAAIEEPIRCRTVTVLAPNPPVKAFVLDPAGRRKRLLRDHFRVVPGGVEVGAPELRVGGALVLEVAVPPDQATLMLAPAPAHPVRAAETHEVRMIALHAKHPGWGFADPKLSATRTEVHRVGPDGASVWEAPGAAAQGIVQVAPGSFTLLAPAVQFATWASPGVTASRVKDGMRWDAPDGGEARWRVIGVGPDSVIPDGSTFLAGIDWRFSQASLPEPATPVRFRALKDREQLVRGVLAEVRALTDASLPGADPLRPRPLLRAWQSGWATSVERGLILHRMLGQERIPAAWALTGTDPESHTMTGYDAMLVVATVDEHERILDAGCRVCGIGEFSTRWAGKPAMGVLERIPKAPGTMKRTLSLNGETFKVRFEAAGAAALWIREIAAGIERARRDERLAEELGMPGARVLNAEGIEATGKPVVVELEGSASPRHPFAEGEEPWEGGWVDL